MSIFNKVMLYYKVTKPIWMQSIQLWGFASKSNLNLIQKCQNKIPYGVVTTQWYVRNNDIHKDLEIPTVADKIKSC